MAKKIKDEELLVTEEEQVSEIVEEEVVTEEQEVETVENEVEEATEETLENSVDFFSILYLLINQ